MKTFNNKIIISTAIAAVVGFTSCSDFLKEHSQDLAKVESWRDLDEVLLGDGYMHSARIISQYGGIPSSDGASGLDILHLMTDEIEMNEGRYCHSNDFCGLQYDMFPFYTWQQDTGTDYLLKYTGGDAAYWNDMYSRINVCNMVIYMTDELADESADDTFQKERVKGEAYFLRGMYHFFLANLYAQPYDPSTASSTPGIPIKTSAIVEDIEYFRENLDVTYQQILSDFMSAADLLEDKTAKSKYHAGYEAVLLMLARTYLYMQDWDNAILYADKLLARNSSLQYISTVASSTSCVSLSSPETIFTMGHYNIAANFSDDSWGDYQQFFSVSKNMRELYADYDMRKNRYVGQTHSGYYDNAFIKYYLQYPVFGGYSDVSSYCLLRTPEAYLIKAEAQAYKQFDSDAVNTLRPYLASRMTSNPAESLQGHALIDFIRDERAREFLLEGHRWFDLRRYTVCQPYKWSKAITHAYIYYSNSYNVAIDYIDTYRLEEYDQAYTLPIPREIRQFQVSIGNNPRPARQAVREDFTQDDDDDDDYDDWDW